MRVGVCMINVAKCRRVSERKIAIGVGFNRKCA